MTTTMAPAPRETYKAARERLEARRQSCTSYTEREELQAKLEGRTLPRIGLYAPTFRPPETAAEFFDDRIIERNSQFFGKPETPVLIEVAAAAREGAAAAVRAVKAARELDTDTQWVVYQNLVMWKHHDYAARTGAERIIARVLSAWSDLKLAEVNPDRGY